MDWSREIDIYCERITPEYWGEPLNAVTNIFFLISAYILWRRVQGLRLAKPLVVLLATIGIGSFLFHTHAQAWAGLADILPIVLFILVYFFAINLDIFKMKDWVALFVAMCCLPFALITIPVLTWLPWLKTSISYIPVLLLILIYAFFLRKQFKRLAKGMMVGALIFSISLIFRSLDESICDSFPQGTHFIWHSLNAIVLGSMIEIYRKQMVSLKD